MECYTINSCILLDTSSIPAFDLLAHCVVLGIRVCVCVCLLLGAFIFNSFRIVFVRLYIVVYRIFILFYDDSYRTLLKRIKEKNLYGMEHHKKR